MPRKGKRPTPGLPRLEWAGGPGKLQCGSAFRDTCCTSSDRRFIVFLSATDHNLVTGETIQNS